MDNNSLGQPATCADTCFGKDTQKPLDQTFYIITLIEIYLQKQTFTLTFFHTLNINTIIIIFSCIFLGFYGKKSDFFSVQIGSYT